MRYFRLCFSVAVLFLSACSGKAPATVVPQPVTGTVIYDGKPAAGVEVFFFPTDAPMVPQIPQNPSGTTDAQGRFSLTTFQDRDGAAEGEYQVILRWQVRKENSEVEEESQPDRLLGWYDGAHSRLTCRVQSGANEVPAFNLPKQTLPPPKSNGVPGRN